MIFENKDPVALRKKYYVLKSLFWKVCGKTRNGSERVPLRRQGQDGQAPHSWNCGLMRKPLLTLISLIGMRTSFAVLPI